MKFLMLLSILLASQVFALEGMDSCAYGTKGCNACVSRVREAFDGIGDGRSERHKFLINPKGRGLNEFPEHPWRFLKDHIQSVVRIPGLGDENWLALTRSAEKMGDGGLFLVRFQDIKSDGRSWKYAPMRKSDKARDFSFHPISTANHPGGLQPLGSLLFVANECSGVSCEAHIQVYDVSEPARPKLVNTLTVAQEEEARNHPRGVLSSKASSVGVTKLEDGRYLVYVGGRHSGKYGWFYLSDTPEITPETRWIFLNSFHSEDFPGIPWIGWENGALVTECESKNLYYITMGERKSHSHLYQVVEEKGKLSFRFLMAKKFNASLFNTFRMGAGVHITPDHSLLMYSTTRFGQRINEFRQKK